MKPIKITAAALNQTPLDWQRNLANIRAAISAAREENAALLCLPELAITGYGCEDAFFSETTCALAWQTLENLLPESKDLVITVGLPIRHAHTTYNAAALIADGKLIGLVAKKNLAGDGIHYEPRWFKPWPEELRDDFIAPDGTRYPIGDLVFDLGGVRLGFEICEDAWVASRPGSRMARLGVDVILNPSASHFAFGKCDIRERFVVEGSRAFSCAYIYANLLGNEAGRVIYDGQLMMANAGSLISESQRFGFQNIRTLTTTLDLSLGRLAKNKLASHLPKLPSTDAPGIVRVDHDWRFEAIQSPTEARPRQLDKFEEFTHAVTLGLHDYMRKSHSSGYVVSLSGGADSAAAASLVRLMVDLARGENPDAYPQDFADVLLTAYQATENSGDTTRNAAATLARALQCTHHELDISELHRGYLQMIEQATGGKLNWDQHDITLQNVQARVRSPGIWMFANLRNSILLTTSNRSEAAVGYATMDGDTSGGLAPIAGIDKHFLRSWLCWLEATGPEINGARHPIPELAAVNAQTPTAELRPGAEHQTDEEDLMPYPVLDFIERSAIRDQRSPGEILPLLAHHFPDSDEETRKGWIKRFFRLWSRNQWKRERYAPSFHLDDENLDPKTWCRWPILSGGFEQQLNDL